MLLRTGLLHLDRLLLAALLTAAALAASPERAAAQAPGAAAPDAGPPPAPPPEEAAPPEAPAPSAAAAAAAAAAGSGAAPEGGEPAPAAAVLGEDVMPSGEPETVAVPAEGAPDTTLGEMVVTADRRQVKLQDYAGSATAFTQQDLQRAGVNSVRDVAKLTPSVEIGSQEGNTEIFVRGIGSDYNTELGDPAVAVHIDGIYIPRPRGVGTMLFDVERLEIGRGPQGTLRGRNATGGTFNVITAKPVLGEWLAEGSVQLGNYSERIGRGMVNVPLGDKLALRLATFLDVHDPFYENAGPVYTIKPSESADTLAYRASLLWEPHEKVKAVFTHDFTQEGGTGYNGSNYASALRAGLLPEEIPDPRAVVYRGPQGSQDMLHWGVSGDVTVDLGPVLIGYLGGYRNLSYKQVSAGNDGIAYPGRGAPDIDNWSTSYWHTTSKSIVQELRLFAPDSARFRWTVGGFLFNEDQTAFLGQAQDKSSDFVGTEFNMPDVNGSSYAGYVDATYDIMEHWRATAGARYTTESKSRNGIGYVYGFSGLMDTPFRFGTEGFRWKGMDRTDYTASGAPMAPFEDFLNGVDRFGARDTLQDVLKGPGVSEWANLNEQHGDYSDQYMDFRVGTDFDLADENMLYVMFSTGHKSGGFNDNIQIMGGGSIAPTYEPEEVYATEVGSKNEFMHGKLVANVAAFWYHYANQQFQTIQRVAGSSDDPDAEASSSVRFNAANSRVLGVEAEVVSRLPAGLQITVAAAVIDAQVTDGEVADTRLGYDAMTQPVVDLAGNQLPRAPLLTVNYGIGQRIPTSVGTFDWRFGGQTKSQQFMTVFNGEGTDSMGNVNPLLSDVVPSYTRLDASVGYARPNGALRVDAFVSNLTDVAFMTSIINTPSLNLRFFNPPRQFGVRLSVML